MRTLLGCLATALAIALSGIAHAQTPLELAIKATYLYKLAPFVDWPAASFDSPVAPLNICIVGADPFGAVLDQAVAGQRVAGHPLVLRRVSAPAPDCHIAFVAGPEAFVAQTLGALRALPVLTVTDVTPHSAARGIVNFIVIANHVRFDIDDEQAARSGLSVSSKLLSLAREVRPR